MWWNFPFIASLYVFDLNTQSQNSTVQYLQYSVYMVTRTNKVKPMIGLLLRVAHAASQSFSSNSAVNTVRVAERLSAHHATALKMSC